MFGLKKKKSLDTKATQEQIDAINQAIINFNATSDEANQAKQFEACLNLISHLIDAYKNIFNFIIAVGDDECRRKKKEKAVKSGKSSASILNGFILMLEPKVDELQELQKDLKSVKDEWSKVQRTKKDVSNSEEVSLKDCAIKLAKIDEELYKTTLNGDLSDAFQKLYADLEKNKNSIFHKSALNNSEKSRNIIKEIPQAIAFTWGALSACLLKLSHAFPEYI